jgi:hypothetical protein
VTDERCERTELIVTQCAHCLGHTDPVADALAGEPARHVEDPEVPVRIPAQFPGRCPDCGEHIHIGDTIVRRSNAWCCTECEP